VDGGWSQRGEAPEDREKPTKKMGRGATQPKEEDTVAEGEKETEDTEGRR
jgi:hypothetical protein